jgi:hypothetical protein
MSRSYINLGVIYQPNVLWLACDTLPQVILSSSAWIPPVLQAASHVSLLGPAVATWQGQHCHVTLV